MLKRWSRSHRSSGDHEGKLLKASDTDPLKKHLNETRITVAQHLEQGEKL